MVLAIKALTAVLSIAVGIGVGVVWFVIANAYEPFFAVDVRFYFNLYTEIGAASGFFSWFMATLLRSGHVPLEIAPNIVVLVLFALALVPICAVAIRAR